MLLAMDVGNTNITLGAFDGDKLCFVSRLATERYRTCDQYAVELKQIDRFFDAEEKVAGIVERLINEKEYVEFLIGRDGDFDQIVSSTVRRAKRDYRDDNSELIWVMGIFESGILK